MAININLNNVESTNNKGETVVGNETSTVKYLSIKGVYDWVTGLLSSYLTSATAASTYEPIFSKNTAFNKNFGTATTDVVEIGATLGNSQVVETNGSGKIITAAKNTAYNKNFGTTAGTVCEGNDSRLLSYCVQSRFYGSINPLDSTTYYPVYVFSTNLTSNDVRSRHKVMKSGTLFNLAFTYSCTAGSNEGVTIQVHNLTAATSLTVTSTVDMSVASGNLQWLNQSLTYTVGDEIQVRILTPAWATNPTGLLFNVDLMFI